MDCNSELYAPFIHMRPYWAWWRIPCILECVSPCETAKLIVLFAGMCVNPWSCNSDCSLCWRICHSIESRSQVVSATACVVGSHRWQRWWRFQISFRLSRFILSSVTVQLRVTPSGRVTLANLLWAKFIEPLCVGMDSLLFCMCVHCVHLFNVYVYSLRAYIHLCMY